MTSRLLGSPTGKLYFYRLLAPVLGVASTIAGVWMIGANIDNGADWSRLFGPLEWHAMTLNMLAIYGGVVVGIIDIWKRQMPFRWPLTLAGLASGTATGQFIAFRFGVQRDRWAVLMLLSVAALIWLSTQAARNSRAPSSTVGLK